MKLTLRMGLLFTLATTVCPADDWPTVGAIRWDAWTGGPVTEQVERTLGPKKYHDRLPWFAEIIDDATVRINGGRQGVMEREITLAAGAGLDYWAFLIYPKGDTMSAALEQYLRGPNRNQIRFCLILHGTLFAPADQWPAERDRALALLREPGYQTVLDNRPLVYAFTGGDFPFDRFHEFLSAAHKSGINPYCVYMGWNPASDYQTAGHRGFDAVSAYAMSGDQPTFAGLSESVEKRYWGVAADSGTPCVPLASTGWDKQPRKDHPVSWEIGHGYHAQAVFPATAAPAEITAHIRNSLKFVRQHPRICPANTVIIYAWNEYDEGGWLAPTRGRDGTPDTSRLDALRQALEGQDSAAHAPER